MHSKQQSEIDNGEQSLPVSNNLARDNHIQVQDSGDQPHPAPEVGCSKISALQDDEAPRLVIRGESITSPPPKQPPSRSPRLAQFYFSIPL